MGHSYICTLGEDSHNLEGALTEVKAGILKSIRGTMAICFSGISRIAILQIGGGQYCGSMGVLDAARWTVP